MHRFLLALLAAFLASLAQGYSSGPPGCVNEPNHGSSFKTNGGRFIFQVKDLDGNLLTSYVPGAVHQIDMAAGIAGVNFKGFLFAVFPGSVAPTSMLNSKAGSVLTAISPNAAPLCTGSMAHTSNTLKTVVSTRWTAPLAGAGAVYIYGITVETKQNYFKTELLLPEGLPASASSSPSAPATRTPSQSAFPSPSGSQTASPSPVSPTASSSVSPSRTASSSVSSSVEPSPSVSPSFGSSASNSKSPAASPSPSAVATSSPSNSVAASVSPSVTGSASVAATVSVTPSSSPVAFPSSTAISSTLTLRWSVDSAASRVAYRLESQGNKWLAIGRAACNGMLNRVLVPNGCSAPVVIGRLDQGGSVAAPYLLQDQSVDGVTPLPSNQVALVPAASKMWYDASADKTYLSFIRPFVASSINANAHPSELNVSATLDDGYIYAVGAGSSFGYHKSSGYFTLRLSPPTCTAATTCSGHGTCQPAGGCACSVGYVGTACDRCDVGFVASTSGDTSSCVASSDPTALQTTAVSVTLRLNLDYSAVAGEPGTPLRATFESNFLKEMAKVLAVDASRLSIKSVSRGSVIVEVVIAPPPASSASTSTSSAVLATTFAALAQSGAITSSSAGPLLSSFDASTPLAFSNTIMAPSSFVHTVSISSSLSLSWTVTAASNSISMRLVRTGAGAGTSWFAFGLSTGLTMTGGDTVLFEPGRPAGQQLSQVTISARSSSAITTVPAGSRPFTSSSVTVVPAGTTSSQATGSVQGPAVIVDIVRPLAAGSYSGALPIPSSGSAFIISAVGAPSQDTVARHATDDSTVGQLDFSSGSLSIGGVSPLRVAHGAVMWLAWGVLAPAGALMARFMKRVPPATGPKACWFVLHRAVQSAAALLSLVGFIIAIVMCSPGPHFNVPHAVIGLVVVLLGAWQPVNAFFRPHKPKAGEPIPFIRRAWEWAHKGSGYVALLLGCVAIFLGFQVIGGDAAKGVLPGLYGATVAGLILLFGWREWVERTRPPSTAAPGAVPTKQLDSALQPSPLIKTVEMGRKARVSIQQQQQQALELQRAPDAPPSGGRRTSQPFSIVNPLGTDTGFGPERRSFAAAAVPGSAGKN